MRMLNTAAWLLLIVLLACEPANRALWVMLLMAAGCICYITKKKSLPVLAIRTSSKGKVSSSPSF